MIPMLIKVLIYYYLYHSAHNIAGTVSFITLINWPYELSAQDVLASPAGVSIENLTPGSASKWLICSSLDKTNLLYAACTTGESCTQEFTFTIVPWGACSLNGDYTAAFTILIRYNTLLSNFELKMRRDQNGLASYFSTGNITLTLESTDWCNVEQTNVTLMPYMQSYPPPPSPPLPR